LGNFQTDPEYNQDEAYGSAAPLETRNRLQAQYRTNPVTWFEWLSTHLRLPEAGRFLELGCGAGDLWAGRQEIDLPKCRGVLTDFSPAMVASARGKVEASGKPGVRSKLGGRFAYSVLDAQAIAFNEGEFEAVLGIGLIDLVPARVQALNEIRRVLKPGGRFYVTSGGRSHLQEIEALVKPFLPHASYGGEPARFGLENGCRLLSPWFPQVERFLYTDDLVFDRAEPVLAYVLSETWVKQQLSVENLGALAWYVKETLAREGVIRVTTEKGLFVAS
jgi:ubiquinone/menaquinone biosynthesis C-methylase UbiE